MASGDPPNTSPKPSGKKAEKLSQKEQSERFKEAARDLDGTREEFERLFETVVKPKNRSGNQS